MPPPSELTGRREKNAEISRAMVREVPLDVTMGEGMQRAHGPAATAQHLPLLDDLRTTRSTERDAKLL